MAQTPPISPRGRDRALGMLRRLTVGAGAAAVLATAGLGVLAAATHPGTSATASASSSKSSTSTTSGTSSGAVQASQQAPSSASSGSGQATSGGS
jgi:hypothetical protein